MTTLDEKSINEMYEDGLSQDINLDIKQKELEMDELKLSYDLQE